MPPMGCKHSEQTKQKLREINLGKHHKLETIMKIKKARAKQIITAESNKKRSIAMMGEKNHQYGKKHSDEYKKKIGEGVKRTFQKMGGHPFFINKNTSKYEAWRQSRIVTNLREKNPNWNGGTSYEPYDIKFSRKYRKIIKKRDNWMCILCGTKQKRLCVHHIDYNKQNSNEKNLISLCFECHTQTLQNRKMWTSVLIGLMVEKYNYSY